MNQTEYQRELLAFAEKISLSKLEEAKATERVRELEYQRDRFSLDFFVSVMRAQEQKEKNAGGPKGS